MWCVWVYVCGLWVHVMRMYREYSGKSAGMYQDEILHALCFSVYLIHHAVSPPLWQHQSWPRSAQRSPAVQSPLLRSSYWTAGRSPELHHLGGTPEQCSITYAVKRVVSVTLAFTHCSLSSIRSCTSPANYLDHTMAVY